MKQFYSVLTCFFAGILFPMAAGAQQTYFQQFVKYEIHVSLDDTRHMIRATERLEYTNNSKDALPYIWMHLWPNAYRNNKTALGQQLKENGELNFYFGDDKERGRIDSLDFKVDGVSAKLEFDGGDTSDMAKLILPEPLQPGKTIVITTPFRVKIPNGDVSRIGHINQQYQITQWYPKPAVYDRNGWNNIPYLDQGEFYSEFGTYDVFITLPKNYVLGATGNLQDESEIKWLNEKAEATAKIDTFTRANNSFPESDKELKTLHYHQENVHDFAWFCDKRYQVLKGEVTLPHSNRTVTTFVMFTPKNGNIWKKGVAYVNDAVKYYSLWNGDYQYDYCTAVDGALSAGGGMEYPNITVIGGVQSDFMLETVIMHEVGHNWFYGMLGSNERVHGWMDEGMNSANELRYIETKYPEALLLGNTKEPGAMIKTFDLLRYKQKAQYYQLYHLSASTNMDQPIETHSADYTMLNYAGIMYYKTAIVFDYLRGYLGDVMYDKCMQTYFDRWHFKHPMPSDMQQVFEEVSGQKLDWLFKDMIQTTKHVDYKIGSAKKRSDGAWDIEITNKGEVNGPVSIFAIKDDKIRGVIWYEGFSGTKTLSFPVTDADYFRIDANEDIPEMNRKNNIVYTHGLFRHTEPVRLQWLGSLDNPTRTQLFFTPVIGYNMYNGYMPGLALYNHVAPMKRVEYHLMPMYGTRNKDIAGAAGLFFNFTPRKIFQQVNFGFNATRWAYSNVPLQNLDFNKIAPELRFTFAKKKMRSPIKQTLRIRDIFLYTDDTYSDYLTSPPGYTYTTRQSNFIDLQYALDNKRHVNPFDLLFNFQLGGPLHAKSFGQEVAFLDTAMCKLSVTANYSLSISKRKAIKFRVFAGAFLSDKNNNGSYRFRTSSWHGYQDYLFDNLYVGRTETSGFWSQQAVVTDGGFKAPTNFGQSAQWLASLNISAPVPFLSALRVFADVATCSSDAMPSDASVLFDAGFSATIIPNVIEVYFPLLMSKQIKDEFEINDIKFGQQIRFTFNLSSPFKMAESITSLF